MEWTSLGQRYVQMALAYEAGCVRHKGTAMPPLSQVLQVACTYWRPGGAMMATVALFACAPEEEEEFYKLWPANTLVPAMAIMSRSVHEI